MTGEVLVEPDREAIASAFGAPVVIEYGCRDGGILALGCPAGRLHIPQENVILELLDEQGHPVRPGQVGEVVVTHLETYAMPLIRYRTGDLARASTHSRRCECGVSLAALAEVRGRLTDQIVCRAGEQVRRMHALALIYVLREVDGIRQFRITQRSIDELDVDVVPTARFDNDSERTILLGLRRRLGEGVAIRLTRRDHIPPAASGKHACVVSHIN